MPASTTAAAPRWACLIHAVLLAVLLIATTFQAPIHAPAPDAFHEGEYSMYGVDRGHIPSGRPPVLTHGGIDLIPAQAAAMVCRPDHEIVCVRLANSIFTGICEAAFLGVLVLIIWWTMFAGRNKGERA